mmetsp:Transcript_104533/g.156543  ORF Transcript_104533/g.156543 Transcript_104533/m.156543 type:complete len:210 (-) Transcript_104533:167-796(-)
MQHPFILRLRNLHWISLGVLCIAAEMATGFAPLLTRSASWSRGGSTVLSVSSAELPVDIEASLPSTPAIASRYFQLEENEGDNSCLTEVFLADDYTLQVGDTDGPLPAETMGYWMLQDDGLFAMNICRKFNTGYSGSDMGEFAFVVERDFAGSVTQVGGLLALEGSLHVPGDNLGGDAKVGYFSMIDVSEMTDKGKRALRSHLTAACLM